MVEECFNIYDTDKDGKLNIEQLRKALRALCRTYSGKWGTVYSKIVAVFSESALDSICESLLESSTSIRAAEEAPPSRQVELFKNRNNKGPSTQGKTMKDLATSEEKSYVDHGLSFIDFYSLLGYVQVNPNKLTYWDDLAESFAVRSVV